MQKLCARLPTGIAAFALAASSVPGCFSSPPIRVEPNAAAASAVSHTVQRGETIYHIARLYGVSPTRLMATNGFTDPHQLAAGQILIIPLERQAASPENPSLWPVVRAERQFAWPVAPGMVSSPFGIRNGVMHNGVDIVARAGSPVHAADDGTVIFAGRLHGYGNAIILQHTGAYVTIYGHNQVNLVRYGAEVVRGQTIALLGSTGRASGPNLHFEVRFQGRPQNPLAYLPPRTPAGGISFARNGGS